MSPIQRASQPLAAEELWFEGFDGVKWAVPKFAKGEVNRAGIFVAKHFANADPYLEEFYDAMQVVNNWRSSHSYPLHAVKQILNNRAKTIDPRALVAHRLKRFPSIALKLARFPQMSLTQMQDIGGCRAVMPTTLTARKLLDGYRNSFSRSAIDYREYDYISSPKPDGYRSVHLALKYRSKAPARGVYDGLRIEIQIRTEVQHCWATAVEVASTFTGQALKSNVGEEDWKRFFALAGCAFATLLERSAAVAGTPSNNNKLSEELKYLAVKLNVYGVLNGFGQAANAVVQRAKDAHWFLIVTDSKTVQVNIKGYSYAQEEEAYPEYLLLEEQNLGQDNIQTALVSVDSVADLQTAYPNYYFDSIVFVALLSQLKLIPKLN
jgi:ppGpp synthetase/RelA/SpoT-type nucleotidyltranferase